MSSLLDNKELFELNQLFAGLYENDNYQQAFTKFLENLKDLIKFQKGDVYVYRNEDEHINFEDFFVVDWGDGYLDQYINNYADIDDALPIVSLKQPVMFRSSDVFIRDERMKTKYYNELLLPAGMEHSIEGNIYVGDDGYVAGIGIHRSDNFGDFTQKELEIMKLSRPHLVNVARKFIDNKSDIDAFALGINALDDIGEIGICILDENFNVENSNIERNDLVQSEYAGEMTRMLIILCKSLKEKVKKDGFSEFPEENKVQSRISFGKATYYVEVMCREYGDKSHKFVATVYDLNTVFENMLLEVKDRFHLTQREFDILKCAVKGMSNSEIARELFISVPTVKKHLTNVYQKMNIEGKHQVFSAILK